MDKYEEAVLEYIGANNKRLVKYQMEIEYDDIDKCGGSCPDFVVLDFEVDKIFVVEVTVASNSNNILNKVRERESRWYRPLQRLYKDIARKDKAWRFGTVIFVRKDQVDKLAPKFDDSSDVSIKSIDEALFSWNWKWEDKRAINSLDKEAT